jgi:hypothetical protein
MRIGRLARTLTKLHPLQIAARLPNVVLGAAARHMPAKLAPDGVAGWPQAPAKLRDLAESERLRSTDRLARLPAGRLRDYEGCYGLELGAGDHAPADTWASPTALEPYPASVRARRIAVASRCGRHGLVPELARAARVVLIRPEVHLMGNHLLENGMGLACAGAVTRGAEADMWWEAGTRLLGWQLPQQFLLDGGHIERSASYHLALTGALLETYEMANASGRGAPPLWESVISRALGWIVTVVAPDGTYPLFNDAALDAAPSPREVLALGSAVGIAPSPIAELEGAGSSRITTLQASGWIRVDVGRACMFVDAGPDAEGWQPGHAHADGLTFELWVDGARVIADFGVATYEPGREREVSRSTRSHNTVEVGETDSCEVWGAFRLGRRGRARVTRSSLRDAVVSLGLVHDGYEWKAGRPRHERTMELGASWLSIVDRVTGYGSSWISRLRLDRAASGAVRVRGTGDVRVLQDHWYPRHGEARPAMVFEQRASAAAGATVGWRVEW